MRMPLYPAFLSLFYEPRLSDPQFFDVAVLWNIRLSLLLLAAFAAIVAYHLPPLASTNLTLVVGFGYFIFKAGYSQPELLFYFLFFTTFLCCWHLIRRDGSPASLALGALAGTLGGLTHLTKAVMPAFASIFLAIFGGRELLRLVAARRGGGLTREVGKAAGWRLAGGAAMAVCFLAVVYPYIANSKRVFGEYFFNHNTAYYVWYDDGGGARAEMIPFTDDEGRLSMPVERRPSLAKYWRSHSVAQIASRLADGARDTAVRSYRTFGYWKYVLVYVVCALVVAAACWRDFVRLVLDRAALALFLLAYAIAFTLSTAFFVPTSSTGGTRFLLAHLAPLFFVLSAFFVRPPFSTRRWTLLGVTVKTEHVHVLIAAVLALDLIFFLWAKLMSTYGGF
jgi:hypothetical protein